MWANLGYIFMTHLLTWSRRNQMPDEEVFPLFVRLMYAGIVPARDTQIATAPHMFRKISLWTYMLPVSGTCSSSSILLVNDAIQVSTSNRGATTSLTRAFPEARNQTKYVLFSVVFDRVQLSAWQQVMFWIEALIVTFHRFPLEIVFRIYDSCLANGIERPFLVSAWRCWREMKTLCWHSNLTQSCHSWEISC